MLLKVVVWKHRIVKRLASEVNLYVHAVARCIDSIPPSPLYAQAEEFLS